MGDSGALTEFVFLKLRETVKPEDPDNLDGKQFMEIVRRAKTQNGHVWSAWGRTEEDNDAVIWVTEWSIDTELDSIEALRPLTKANSEIIVLKPRLVPSLSSVGGITSSPVADVTTMPFGTNNKTEDLLEILARMKTGVTEEIPKDLRPSYWCISTPETYPILDHPESSTGKAVVSLVVVGWQSSEQHYAIWKTPEFDRVIIPVKERLLSWPPGIGMMHAGFTLI